MKALHEKSIKILNCIDEAEARAATAQEISETFALGFPELIHKYRLNAAKHTAAKWKLFRYYFDIQSKIYESIIKNVNNGTA